MTPNKKDPSERPVKRSPLRVLTSDEYMRKTGRGLIAFPMGNIAMSGPRKPYTPEISRMERVSFRLWQHADQTPCTPFAPPPPPPRSAREARKDRHWEAMWQWSVANGATAVMRQWPGDHDPLMEHEKEWLLQTKRDFASLPKQLTEIRREREGGRLSPSELSEIERFRAERGREPSADEADWLVAEHRRFCARFPHLADESDAHDINPDP